jgi:hypothetical protein
MSVSMKTGQNGKLNTSTKRAKTIHAGYMVALIIGGKL